jgi:hypothetical protein
MSNELISLTAQYLETEHSAWEAHTAKGEKADRLFDVLDNLYAQAMSLASKMGLDRLPEKEAKALIAMQAAERKAALARKEAEAKRIARLVAAAKAA